MNTDTDILYLEFDRELADGTSYIITDPAGEEPGQKIVFRNHDYNIEFPEPVTGLYGYLERNTKWLRSILYTAMKIPDKRGFKIPFSFPSDKEDEPVPDNVIKVYSDGSGNESGTGGWASVIVMPDGTSIESCGYEKNSSSNRMELKASLKALEKASSLVMENTTVLLLTDSMYVINGITHRLEVWRRNGFITATGKPVVNTDLWQELAAVMEIIDVRCRWIKSGSNDEYHRRCDFLAGEESRN